MVEIDDRASIELAVKVKTVPPVQNCKLTLLEETFLPGEFGLMMSCDLANAMPVAETTVTQAEYDGMVNTFNAYMAALTTCLGPMAREVQKKKGYLVDSANRGSEYRTAAWRLGEGGIVLSANIPDYAADRKFNTNKFTIGLKIGTKITAR